MARSYTQTAKQYDFTNKVESPHAFHDGDHYTLYVFARVAQTPTNSITIFDYRAGSYAADGVFTPSGARQKISVNLSNVVVFTQTDPTGVTTDTATSTSITPGEWFMVAITRDTGGGQNITCFLNGVSQGSLSASSDPGTALEHLWLGRDVGGGPGTADLEIASFHIRDADMTGNQLINELKDESSFGRTNSWANLRASLPLENDLYPSDWDGETSAQQVQLSTMMEPEFVDDSSYFGSWSQSAFSQVPAIRNGSNWRADANMKLAFMGDSFNYADVIDTTPKHFINEYGRLAGADLRMLIQGSSDANGQDGNMVIAQEDIGDFASTPGSAFVRTADDGYTVDNGTYNIAMPLNSMTEYEGSGGGTGNKYTELKLRNFGGGTTGPLSSVLNGTAQVDASPIIFRVSNGQLASVELSDKDTNAETRTGLDGLAVHEFHALAPIRLSNNDDANERTLVIANATGSFPQAGRLCIGGARFQKVGVDAGIDLLILSEGSWSYDSYGRNDQSSGSSKEFTVAQFQSLVAQFVETGRRLNLVYHLDNEGNDLKTPSEFVTEIQAIITLADTALSNLGALEPHYTFMTPHMHARGGAASIHTSRLAAENAITAADTVAQGNSRVTAFHLYKLTGGALNHSNAQGYPANDANGPQQAWLDAYDVANGTSWATTPGREMLDGSDLHIIDQASAEFYGTVGAIAMQEVATSEEKSSKIFEPSIFMVA